MQLDIIDFQIFGVIIMKKKVAKKEEKKEKMSKHGCGCSNCSC
jgi:hypothetical protein